MFILMKLVSFVEYSSSFKNICERSNLFTKMVKLWIDFIVVFTNLAEIVYVNGFFMSMKGQIIMP